MKSNKFKMVVSALAISMIAGAFAGCGSKETTSQNSGTSATKEIAGGITASGSTALQPLAEQVGKKFAEKYPDASVNVQGGGSGTGLTQVLQGAVDIGNSDIFAEEKLKPEEAKQLVDHKVAVVAFGVVANTKVKVDNLKQEDLVKIFTGEITNWRQVGGDDMNIIVINRPKSSGTRATFKKYALNDKEEVEGKSLTQDSSGAVKKTIEETDGAIGYLASSFLNEADNTKGLKMIKLDGVEMTKENVINGKYKIWSYEHMYTKGEAKDVAKAFLEYIVSEEVKPVITKLGYIPINDMKVSR
ncbi:phosphate ABC transporter substrate-binding protein [Clostridium swellfunianum]|uniref:phosphate ABC transporter substrate-binding protein n=1 Tax=Clostridium swellfunianum TaxID=1367462 RepID=UPI00202F2F9F|nr:phosphate ABC transporter substrate-binding protein [Clostridium swellfunianum]MCM0650872.1 phosphate ABC transporter substrate-binding protein [Clostridium swellfunianum]